MKSKKPIKLIYPDAVSYVVNDLEKHLKEDLHGMTLKEFAETHGLHYPSLVTLRSRSEKKAQPTLLYKIMTILGYKNIKMNKVVNYEFNPKD